MFQCVNQQCSFSAIVPANESVGEAQSSLQAPQLSTEPVTEAAGQCNFPLVPE